MDNYPRDAEQYGSSKELTGHVLWNRNFQRLLENVEDLKWVHDPMSCRIHMLSYLYPKEAEKLASAAYDTTDIINKRLKIDRKA
jgi:hypothetical protein